MLACYEGPEAGELKEVVEACQEAESRLEEEYYRSARRNRYECELKSSRE
jgi:hypothetical protein